MFFRFIPIFIPVGDFNEVAQRTKIAILKGLRSFFGCNNVLFLSGAQNLFSRQFHRNGE
ncbi:hypothetical protein CSB94_1714 [Pseudomonas aeruginosa]|nr:hypothetical protein CSB94_1714 [Pseudomonas aeruginosa]